MRPLILVKLKQQTRLPHECASATLDLLRVPLSIETYRAILQHLWGFYAPLERQIGGREAWPLSPLDFEKRKKTALLERDLRAMGVSAISELPICTDVPELTGYSEVLGCLYVLEGATLGGQVVSRHLKRTLGLDQATGCAYFYSYGNEVGSMWKAFCRVLVADASKNESESRILQAASSTFLAFNRWLQRSNAAEQPGTLLPAGACPAFPRRGVRIAYLEGKKP